MEPNEYDKEDLLRSLLQRSIDHERMLLENDKRDRIQARKNMVFNILYGALLAACATTSIIVLTVTHNRPETPQPNPSPSESPLYYTP